MVQVNHTAPVKNLIIYKKKNNSDYKIFCEPIHGIRRKETEPSRRKGRCRQAQGTEGPSLSCHGAATLRPSTPPILRFQEQEQPSSPNQRESGKPKGPMAHLEGFWQESDGAAWKLSLGDRNRGSAPTQSLAEPSAAWEEQLLPAGADTWTSPCWEINPLAS